MQAISTKKMTIKQIESLPQIDEVVIDNSPSMRGDCYRVLIYIEDGWRASDGTSTLYGRTVKEAAQGIKDIERGEVV